MRIGALLRTSMVSARRWTARGSISVLDQGLMSGSNFAVGLFFVRVMTPADYGVFSIAFSGFLLLTAFHNALVIEPLSVVGPKRYAGVAVSYLRLAMVLNLLTAAGLSFLAAGAAFALPVQQRVLAGTLRDMAAGSFFIFAFWTLRRGCYLLGTPEPSARASAIYLLVLAGGTGVSVALGWKFPGVPFVIMGVAGIAASLALVRLLRQAQADGDTPRRLSFSGVAAGHWRYARWLLAAGGAVWVAELAYPALLGIYTSPTTAGFYRASELLVMPMYQGVAALALPLQPWVSSQVALRGALYLRSFWAKGSVLVVSATVLYAAALLSGGRSVAAWVYPRSYSGPVLSILAPLCGWLIVRANYDVILGTAVRGAEQTRAVFWASLVGAVFTLAAGTWLIQVYGLRGAAWSKLGGSCLQAGVLAFCLLRVAFPRTVTVSP